MERILFVDDEQFVLDGFKRLLRDFRDKWQIEFALNGKIALEMVKEEDFDVIITDIRMPEMPGLELLQCLQSNENTQKIPVVVLTGDHDRTLKRKALELGAVDLLNKPVNKEDLVARINNVLKLKEYQDIIIEKNRALEKQLVISQKMDLVGVMAAGAVHDLSNLLSIIVGYSNLLIEEDLLDKIEFASMEKIRKAGEKASSLANQILKFSRLDERISIINVGDLIDDIISIVATAAAEDIKIVWEKPKENILMRSNAVKLQQVLLNLCINAIHAMEDSGGRLTITLHPIEHDIIRIDVRDTGIGIDEKTKEKIFTPLFTTKEDGKGTGLGLFVVKHILDDYSGKIEVDSEKGKGSTFRIFFPLFHEQSVTSPSDTDLIRIFGT
jgi:signal transduction histidine kinase